jgi:mono/diheme cytochrome c family protein
MPRYLCYLIKFWIGLSIAVFLSACGGGGDDDGESENSGVNTIFSTSTNAATNSANGQVLYAANCASCHGASYFAAKNYASTLSAIARNKGGMGYLSNIGTAEANDIASYLAFGATASPLPTQSINFAALINQTLGGAPINLTAVASSGLSVTFTSSTAAVCSVSGTALTLLASGICTLTASQTGNTSFAAASPVTRSFNVAAAPGLAQTISFTSPGQQYMGVATPALVATATSNLPVTFASTTNSVCTVSGSALTLRLPGTCTVLANQTGSATYASAATITNTFYVVATNAAAGKTIYNQQFSGQSCASCHGVPGSQSTSLILSAANADVVLNSAILNNIGGMRILTGRYSAQQILDMAAYLATPNF